MQLENLNFDDALVVSLNLRATARSLLCTNECIWETLFEFDQNHKIYDLNFKYVYEYGLVLGSVSKS